MPKLLMTPLVVQALTAPGVRKGPDYSTFRENGKKLLVAELEQILEHEYHIYEHAWYFINTILSNQNLSEVFRCLEEKYTFFVTIPKKNRFNHGLTERMKAQVVYALAFAGHNDMTENKTLLSDILVCLKKHISIVEDAYFTVYKMIDRDNKYARYPVDMKKLFTIQHVAGVYIALFTYANVTESGKGASKETAKIEACKNWLANDKKN